MVKKEKKWNGKQSKTNQAKPNEERNQKKGKLRRKKNRNQKAFRKVKMSAKSENI